MEKTPEEILASEAGQGQAKEIGGLSAEDLIDAEEEGSQSDAYSEADAREETIELNNDSVDTLVDESQDVSDEGIDDGRDRG